MSDQVWIDLRLDTGKKARVYAWPVKPGRGAGSQWGTILYVHKRHYKSGYDRQKLRGFKRNWTLSHRPSGNFMAHFTTKGAATDAAREVYRWARRGFDGGVVAVVARCLPKDFGMFLYQRRQGQTFKDWKGYHRMQQNVSAGWGPMGKDEEGDDDASK